MVDGVADADGAAVLPTTVVATVAAGVVAAALVVLAYTGALDGALCGVSILLFKLSLETVWGTRWSSTLRLRWSLA